MHGFTRNSPLALLVLYIPSGISIQSLVHICYKSAMEVGYTLACNGSKQFYDFSESSRHLVGGIFAIVS